MENVGLSRSICREVNPEPVLPAKAMETQEALKACAQLRNSVQDKVSDLLARGVVATDTVIDSIFLACDELLRVELLALGASVNFISGCGSQVCDHCPGRVPASTCLTKEGMEGVLSSSGLTARHLPIRPDAVFLAVGVPAGITVWTPAWPSWMGMHSGMEAMGEGDRGSLGPGSCS